MEPVLPEGRWSLEVVRGRRPGQTFPILGPECVLGNAPVPPSAGIDLAGQEGSKTRRMAAQHATLAASGLGLAIRDLESPCGTFVNRRRVLPGQDCPLRAGDEIQLGAVVLRVANGVRSANGVTTTPEVTFAYVVDGGPTCRTWDDFLVASSQRWDTMCDELASGRLATFLSGIGRADLLPRSASGSTADERLDAWLAGLPTARPSRPELDVHPDRVVVQATPGGGTVRRSARVANVGHRLLRSSARVEPPQLGWLRLAPEFDDAPFATVEDTRLDFDIVIPKALPAPLSGEIVVEGNGGTRRIAVILEPRSGPSEGPEPATPAPGPSPQAGRLAGWASRAEIPSAALGLGLSRLAVAVAGGGTGKGAGVSAPGGPGLAGVALAMAAVGAMVGLGLATWRGGRRATFPGAFAGGCVGAMVAAVVVAACRSIEPAVLGTWAASPAAVCGLWAAMGAGLAGFARLAARGRS